MMGEGMRGMREVVVGGPGGGRVPQWGQQETRELIAIRGEMERGKRSGGAAASNNKTLWEVVAVQMSHRGYSRTPDQCKCKWKNLVNRYKGKETSDPENGRHCPFFDELHEVFTERARSMQRQLLESESGGGSSSRKKLKRSAGDLSSYELSDDDDVDDDASDGETKPAQGRRRKQKINPSASTSGRSSSSSNIQELLQGFLQQQQAMEMQWREAMERRATERMLFEQGWRESMERLERERLMLEQAWMEREEQRRMREETRAEKRDQLLTTLLNMLQNDL
ncbi:Trihelix transcription factor GT-3b [Rhynchospora pubera]|uniref:Trihelix transcription factor GT-3b n=1 Tax=Rhynchospora pubera TaxID=906938 RepID=A0AAV8H285_9POAL|nr:Trihelix transcription factor GT-3b [Rhynchospora pubera]